MHPSHFNPRFDAYYLGGPGLHTTAGGESPEPERRQEVIRVAISVENVDEACEQFEKLDGNFA